MIFKEHIWGTTEHNRSITGNFGAMLKSVIGNFKGIIDSGLYGVCM